MKGSLVAILIGLTAVVASPAEFGDEWVLVPDVDLNMHLISVKDLEFQAAIGQRGPTIAELILFTRANPLIGQIIPNGDVDALKKSHFNPNNPTRFISHGWRGSRASQENGWIRDKYLGRGEYNVFVIDWSSGADTINYIAASKNTMEAGKQVAAFIDFAHDNVGLKFETLYLIGHSLGGHVVGTAGKHVTRGKINTIFGLDAALPLFSIDEPSKRLDKNDALYVESIHTDGGGLGFDVPLGDASFYPNWGSKQPGCTNDLTGGCSHTRSTQYFTESLDNVDNFVAEQCNDYKDIKNKSCDKTGRIAKMGGEPSNYGLGVTGEYYMPTNSQNPFALGTKWMN